MGIDWEYYLGVDEGRCRNDDMERAYVDDIPDDPYYGYYDYDEDDEEDE